MIKFEKFYCVICPKCKDKFELVVPDGLSIKAFTLGEIAYEHSLGSCPFRPCDRFLCRAKKIPSTKEDHSALTRHLRYHEHLGQRFSLIDQEEMG